jgi:hypothetical protein
MPAPDTPEQGVGAVGIPAGDHAMIAGDRQHVADAAGLELGAQGGVGAVGLVAGDPGGRDAGVQRAGEHLGGQGWLGGKPDLVGDAGSAAAVGIAGPGAGQVQLPVDDGVAAAAGVD